MGKDLVSRIVALIGKIGLKPNELVVFLTIALTVLDKPKDGALPVYWEKRKALEEKANLSSTSVKVALHGLVAAGWLIQEPTDKGRPGQTARYRVNVPKLAALAAEAEKAHEGQVVFGRPVAVDNSAVLVRKADLMQSGNRTPLGPENGPLRNQPEEPIEEPTSFTAHRDATGAEIDMSEFDTWGPSTALMELWQDYYVLAKWRLPSSDLIARVRSLTAEQFEEDCRYLWRDAHQELRFDGGDIDHHAKRDQLIDAGAISLLSHRGRRKLMERVKAQGFREGGEAEFQGAA
ncbi:hypothetical protein ACFOYW_16865 [Gryllotalpicola reticulitermitis]|uniref:Helix-turn-helix domain-containing protein n=1 Tax=Gryllotalpicola reticulitermitis TaxID=1184153 RepID=A0ABV8Q9L5_9MICO